MTGQQAGPVDRYLDTLFDLLAGSGAPGRRALAEVEAHLAESVDAELAGGASRPEAERRAVARFGPARTVADGLLAAHSGGIRVLAGRLVGAAWLLGGLGLAVIGLSGLPVWVIGRWVGRDLVAPDAPGAHHGAARCAELLEYAPHATGCRAAAISHHFDEEIRNRIAAGALGLLVLAAFWLVRRARSGWLARFGGLTGLPPAPLVGAVGATAFGAAAGLLTGQGLDTLMIGQRTGAGANLAGGLVCAVAFVVFLPPAVRVLRMRPS